MSIVLKRKESAGKKKESRRGTPVVTKGKTEDVVK
jgi:hypothetical protein